MLLDSVFAPFVQERPICVMARGVLERLLDADRIDTLFAHTATHQYTRELLFSSVVQLTRIIHQPEKSAREDTFGTRMILSMTVSQDDHDSKTPSSDCPGTGLIDLLAAIGRNPSCQPPGVYLRRLALEPLGLSIELTGPARSDARRLIRSNSASTPAPPDTTRATRS